MKESEILEEGILKHMLNEKKKTWIWKLESV